jgi:hypothetical protein
MKKIVDLFSENLVEIKSLKKSEVRIFKVREIILI